MAFQISKERVEALDVKACFFAGWDILKANPIQIFIAFIFCAVGSVITIGVLAASLYAGLLDYILKLKNKDESAKPTDVFSKFNILVPGLLVFILMVGLSIANGLIIGGIFGKFVSILTGLIVSSITISFATISIPLLSSGKLTDAMEAIQTAWNAFLLSPVTFFILAVAVNVLSFVGLLCFGIGILVTAPLSVCIMAVASEKFTKDNSGSISI